MGPLVLSSGTIAERAHSSSSDVESTGCSRAGDKRAKWIDRIGLWSFLVLLLGSVIILLMLFLLIYFWHQSFLSTTGANPARIWKAITRSSWTTKVVTISTAIMRVIMAVQASTLTSMFSGIILEKTGTPLLYAPLYSTMRALRGSPQDLLHFDSFRTKNPMSLLLSVLICVEILAITGSQFMSTLLLSDFDDGVFKDEPNPIMVPGFPYTTVATMGHLWTSSPRANWRFAEYSEAPLKGPDFVDTGHTYRAFIPLDDEDQRTRLREFSGEAFVQDQRVACVNPSLTGVTLHGNGLNSPVLAGDLRIDKPYPMLDTPSTGQIKFNCSVFFFQVASPDQTNLCLTRNELGSGPGMLQDPLIDPSLVTDPTYYGRADDGLDYVLSTPRSHQFLVLQLLNDTYSVDGGGENMTVTRSDGPWAILSGASDEELVRATACHTTLAAKRFVVRMSSPQDGPEPRIPWAQESNAFDTTARRYQLGATSEPQRLVERGVLALEPRSQWKDAINKKDLSSPELDIAYELVENMFHNGIISHRPTITFADALIQSHEYHATIFLDTIRATRNPALSVQALFTVFSQMVYYNGLQRLSSNAPATAAFSSSIQIPSRWTGFIGTSIIVAIHLTVVLVVTTVFLLHTRSSMLGNFWQTVSQVVTEETLPILGQADHMKDKDVAHGMGSAKGRRGGDVLLRRLRNGRTILKPKDNDEEDGLVARYEDLPESKPVE